jgi:hypothetical protein
MRRRIGGSGGRSKASSRTALSTSAAAMAALAVEKDHFLARWVRAHVVPIVPAVDDLPVLASTRFLKGRA